MPVDGPAPLVLEAFRRWRLKVMIRIEILHSSELSQQREGRAKQMESECHSVGRSNTVQQVQQGGFYLWQTMMPVASTLSDPCKPLQDTAAAWLLPAPMNCRAHFDQATKVLVESLVCHSKSVNKFAIIDGAVLCLIPMLHEAENLIFIQLRVVAFEYLRNTLQVRYTSIETKHTTHLHRNGQRIKPASPTTVTTSTHPNPAISDAATHLVIVRENVTCTKVSRCSNPISSDRS